MNTHSTHWKPLLSQGNKLFNQQNWSHARHYYQDACKAALAEFKANETCISEASIASVLVCHFNLADTHLRLNRNTDAANQYITCFRFLLTIIENKPNNIVFISAFSRSLTEWLTLKKIAFPKRVIEDPPEIERIQHILNNTGYSH